jgi:hypothetical protein
MAAVYRVGRTSIARWMTSVVGKRDKLTSAVHSRAKTTTGGRAAAAFEGRRSLFC